MSLRIAAAAAQIDQTDEPISKENLILLRDHQPTTTMY